MRIQILSVTQQSPEKVLKKCLESAGKVLRKSWESPEKVLRNVTSFFDREVRGNLAFDFLKEKCCLCNDIWGNIFWLSPRCLSYILGFISNFADPLFPFSVLSLCSESKCSCCRVFRCCRGVAGKWATEKGLRQKRMGNKTLCLFLIITSPFLWWLFSFLFSLLHFIICYWWKKKMVLLLNIETFTSIENGGWCWY